MENLEWLVYRQDHAGKRDVVRHDTGDGSPTYCWHLSEERADEEIRYVQRDHRKPHGQTYDKLSYEKGKLMEFLEAEKIRY